MAEEIYSLKELLAEKERNRELKVYSSAEERLRDPEAFQAEMKAIHEDYLRKAWASEVATMDVILR